MEPPEIYTQMSRDEMCKLKKDQAIALLRKTKIDEPDLTQLKIHLQSRKPF